MLVGTGMDLMALRRQMKYQALEITMNLSLENTTHVQGVFGLLTRYLGNILGIAPMRLLKIV